MHAYRSTWGSIFPPRNGEYVVLPTGQRRPHAHTLKNTPFLMRLSKIYRVSSDALLWPKSASELDVRCGVNLRAGQLWFLGASFCERVEWAGQGLGSFFGDVCFVFVSWFVWLVGFLNYAWISNYSSRKLNEFLIIFFLQ